MDGDWTSQRPRTTGENEIARLIQSHGWLTASRLATDERHRNHIRMAEQAWMLREKPTSSRRAGLQISMVRRFIGRTLIALGSRIVGPSDELKTANQ